MAAKNAIKDVARVYGVAPSEANAITKTIPNKPGITIESALQEFPEFVSIIKNNQIYEKVVRIAQKIEGLPRQTGVHACFDENTFVRTETGMTRISDIKIGDKVLTDKGRFKKVINTMVTESDDIYEIHPSSSTPIVVTGNHPFLIRKAIYGSGRKKIGYSAPEWVSVENIQVSDYVGTRISDVSQGDIPLVKGIDTNNCDFWHLIGMYIGDGWTEFPKRGLTNSKYRNDKRIIICSDKEGIKLSKIEKDLNKLGIKYRVSNCETVYKVYISSLSLYDFLQQFGKGAINKELGNVIFNLPKKYIISFILGYLDSDGCVLSNGVHSFSTISYKLATEIINILDCYFGPCTLGIRAAGNSTILGRNVAIHKKYTIFFNPYSAYKSSSFVEGEILWHKIKKVKKIDSGIRKMYNLTVEDDHTYTANGVIVHNCGICIGQKTIDEYCPTARVKDDDGEYFMTTQFEGLEAEEVGLVKFDFLGLRTLDAEDIALELIRENNPDFNMSPDDIPINDIQSYLALKEGKTDGVFQFESDGMTGLVKQMFSDVEPTDNEEKGEEYFERLTAAVALYRPGPEFYTGI